MALLKRICCVGIFRLAALRRRFLPRQVDRVIGKIRAMSCQSAVPAAFVSLRRRPARVASTLAKLLCLPNKGGCRRCRISNADNALSKTPRRQPRLRRSRISTSGRSKFQQHGHPRSQRFEVSEVLGRALMDAERHAVAASQPLSPLTTCGPVAGIGVRFYRFVLG